ncbi:MAG TPA: SH3 domain-containing protein [Burkholderiales bacterium]|nr:SH3 domain-containing protein [Burkholderiales bacterium]
MRFLLLFAFLLPIACAAEPATVIRATELKQGPATDAPTVAQLPVNTAVDALERKGGWTRVKAPGGEGWVKMLSLRYGGAAKAGDSGVSQLFNVARTGSSGTQVTTGVRGLDAEQIAAARPNAAELKKLQSFAETRDASSAFAEGGRLQPQRVAYPK